MAKLISKVNTRRIWQPEFIHSFNIATLVMDVNLDAVTSILTHQMSRVCPSIPCTEFQWMEKFERWSEVWLRFLDPRNGESLRSFYLYAFWKTFHLRCVILNQSHGRNVCCVDPLFKSVVAILEVPKRRPLRNVNVVNSVTTSTSDLKPPECVFVCVCVFFFTNYLSFFFSLKQSFSGEKSYGPRRRGPRRASGPLSF